MPKNTYFLLLVHGEISQSKIDCKLEPCLFNKHLNTQTVTQFDKKRNFIKYPVGSLGCFHGCVKIRIYCFCLLLINKYVPNISNASFVKVHLKVFWWPS